MGHRVLFLEAPAGYGKTTVLSQWAVHQKRPLCWYSFDPGDRADRLALHLGESLVETGMLLYPPGNLDGILAALCAHEREYVLVLDDCHLHQDEEIQTFLHHLLNRVPSNALVLLASREAPHPTIARLCAHGIAHIFRTSDLQLSQEETGKILGEAGHRLAQGQIADIHRQTEGWAAAVQLVQLAHPHDQAFLSAMPATRQELWDYLANEVFATIPWETQSKLIRLSLLERFSFDLTRELDIELESSISQAWGPFLIELRGDGIWYRFHHLVGRYLRRQAEVRLSREKREEIHSRASLWFSESGYFEEAIGHALQARDWARVQEMLTRESSVEKILHYYGRAQEWFERLPADVVKGSWRLSAYLGVIFLGPGRLDGAEKAFQAALRDPSCADRFMCLCGLALVTCARGQSQRADELITQASGVRAQGPSQALGELFLISIAVHRGRVGAAQVAMNQLYQNADAKSLVFKSTLGVLQADVHLRSGQLEFGLRSCDALLSLGDLLSCQAGLTNKIGAAWGLKARALAQLGHTQKADQAWDLFDVELEKHGSAFYLGHLCSARARFLIRHGRLDDARCYIDKLLLTHDPVDSVLLKAAKVDLLLAEGRLDEAAPLLRDVEDFGADPPHYAYSLIRSCLKFHIAAHNLTTLAEYLPLAQRGMEKCQADQRVWDELEWTLLLAQVELALGHKSKARRLVRGALDLGRPLGFWEVFNEENPIGELARALDPSLVEADGDYPLGLTRREWELLALLDQGLSNQEIADKAFLTLTTVKWHNRRIFKKLGVKRRTQAVSTYRRLAQERTP